MHISRELQTPQHYHRHIRKEIFPLLPREAKRLLDVGAGSGVTSRWLKNIYPSSVTVAVEANSSISEELRANVDEAHIGDLNVIDTYLGAYDLVLCLDVLEHLLSPEIVLQKIVESLPIGATVIISLPNVAHLSVSIPLFFMGKFDYREEGILDRTHLHFYTEKSALALAQGAGLTPIAGVITGLNSGLARLIDVMTFGVFRNTRLAFQYIFASQKLSNAMVPRMRWKLACKPEDY